LFASRHIGVAVALDKATPLMRFLKNKSGTQAAPPPGSSVDRLHAIAERGKLERAQYPLREVPIIVEGQQKVFWSPHEVGEGSGDA
jgi:hypothetical protein